MSTFRKCVETFNTAIIVIFALNIQFPREWCLSIHRKSDKVITTVNGWCTFKQQLTELYNLPNSRSFLLNSLLITSISVTFFLKSLNCSLQSLIKSNNEVCQTNITVLETLTNYLIFCCISTDFAVLKK